MKTGQKAVIKQTLKALPGCAMVAGLAASLTAANVTFDGGATFIMLALTLGALIPGRSAIIDAAAQLGKAQPIPVNSRSSSVRR